MKTAFLRSLILGAASILLVAASISCGRTHRTSTHSTSTSISTGLAARTGGSQAAPATVPLADVLAQIDAYPAPKGVDAARFASLKAELKKQIAARSADGKRLSIAPTAIANAVTDLKAVAGPSGAQATVTWTEKLWGDYDNKGVVDIGDLIPLALYYMQRTDSGPDDAHRLVNGDADPEINIWDLGAIAGNYAAHLEGYQVWRGHWNGSSTDWETAFLPNIGNPTNANWSADRPSPPPVSTRPAYTYTDDISGVADKNNIRYKVAPFGDGGTGPESNEAAVPATTFSVSGKVTLSGAGLAGVTLTLAPGGLHASTQADGTYVISGVADGSYSLTPTATGYVFAPASIPVTVNGANVVGLNFTATGGLANSAWPKFHGNAQNTGQSPYIGAQTNHVKWALGGPGISSPPVIGSDGTLYFSNGKLYALNPSDGSMKWTNDSVRPGDSPVVAADGTLYVCNDNTGLYALSPADGRIVKHYDTGGVSVCPAIGSDGTLYILSNGNTIAMNPGDGSVKWTRAIGGWTTPVIGSDGAVYVTTSEGRVNALNPADGSTKWESTSGVDFGGAPAVGPDGTVYVGSETRMYALSQIDGSIKWTYSDSFYAFTPPAIGDDGTLYVGGASHVAAFNTTDGSIRGEYQADYIGFESLAVGADGTVYSGTGHGAFYALDLSDGTVKWSFSARFGITTGPAIGADGTVYIGGGDGSLYAIGGVGPSTYSISGTVTLNGAGLAGVTMTLTPGGETATTASDGTYKFTDILEGAYTLTPTATGYVFAPAQRSVTVRGLDVTGQDFTAQGGLANSAWPKFHANAQNTGLSPYVGAQTNHVKWTSATGGAENGSAAIGVDGTVYVGSGHYSIRALDPTDGSLKWSLATSAPLESSPAVATDGTVYVGANYGNFYALNPADGSVKWRSVAGDSVKSSPSIGLDGTIYVGSGDHNVYAFNPIDGSVKWLHATGSSVISSPAVGTDGTVYVGSSDHNVYALSPTDGSVRWTYTTGNPVKSSPCLGADVTVYIGSGDGSVYALNPSDGSLKWSYATASIIDSSPAIGPDGTVYIGSWDHRIYALNPADGSVKWSHLLGDRVHSSPAVGADGTVYIGSDDGMLSALNPSDGTVKWSYAMLGVGSSPAIGADGTVYVGSLDGSLYAFGP